MSKHSLVWFRPNPPEADDYARLLVRLQSNDRSPDFNVMSPSLHVIDNKDVYLPARWPAPPDPTQTILSAQRPARSKDRRINAIGTPVIREYGG